jgi:hypothetical protein
MCYYCCCLRVLVLVLEWASAWALASIPTITLTIQQSKRIKQQYSSRSSGRCHGAAILAAFEFSAWRARGAADQLARRTAGRISAAIALLRRRGM